MSSNGDAETGQAGLLSPKNKPKEKKVEKFINQKEQSFYDSKMFRLISVIMYVCLVSGIGFLFAVYHFFFWDSTMPPVAKVPGHEVY